MSTNLCHLILLSFLLCLRTTNQRAKKERKKFVWREVCAALKKKKRTSLCVFLRKGVNAYSILLEKLEQKFLSRSQFPLSLSFSLAFFLHFIYIKWLQRNIREVFLKDLRDIKFYLYVWFFYSLEYRWQLIAEGECKTMHDICRSNDENKIEHTRCLCIGVASF